MTVSIRARSPATRATRWVPALLVAIAMLVRAWHLDQMSIWQDEGLSLYRATRDLAGILSGTIPLGDLLTRDVHPPAYFLLLAGWFKLVGAGTWTAKYVSLLAALPTVALVWALVRRTAGSRASERKSPLSRALM